MAIDRYERTLAFDAATTDVQAATAPERAAMQAVDVAESAIDKVVLPVIREQVAVAKKARRAEFASELAVKKELFLSKLTEEIAYSRETGDSRAIMRKLGSDLERRVETETAGYDDPEERLLAKSELTEAGSSLFGQAARQATLQSVQNAQNNYRNFGGLVVDNIGAGKETFTAGFERISSALDEAVGSGIMDEQTAIYTRDKLKSQAANAAVMDRIGTAERLFTNGDSAGAVKTLRDALGTLPGDIGGADGSVAEKQLSDAVQGMENARRSRDEINAARWVRRQVQDIRADASAMEEFAKNGDAANFERKAAELNERYVTSLEDIRSGKKVDPDIFDALAVGGSPENIEIARERLTKVRAPREWANRAMVSKQPEPLPATPDNVKVVNAAYETSMKALSGAPLTERLGYTNAVINNTGMVTPAMTAQYTYAFDQVGQNPAYGPVLLDSLSEFESLSPYAYGQFIQTKEGQQMAVFQAKYRADLQAAANTAGGPNPSVIAASAYQTAVKPASQTTYKDRRENITKGDASELLAKQVKNDLPDLIGKKLGPFAQGYDGDDFSATINSGVNGAVYQEIIAKARDYYVFGTAGLEKDKAAISTALDMAVSDVLTRYQWGGKEFKRGSPLSMGAGPGDNPRIYRDISDKIVQFGGADVAEAGDVARQAQYLGGVRGGWILYVNNRVVTNDSGEVFVYKGIGK